VINLREHFIIKLFYHQTIAIIKVEHCCPWLDSITQYIIFRILCMTISPTLHYFRAEVLDKACYLVTILKQHYKHGLFSTTDSYKACSCQILVGSVKGLMLYLNQLTFFEWLLPPKFSRNSNNFYEKASKILRKKDNLIPSTMQPVKF
jgi:hypothetical protein